MVKPGGMLLIDHRNYDYIVENGSAPTHNIYYNVSSNQNIYVREIYTVPHSIDCGTFKGELVFSMT